MKKGQIAEGYVIRTEFPGKGIVRVERICGQTGEQPEKSGEDTRSKEEADKEVTAVVKQTLPGQYIRFRITKKRSGRLEGQLLEVLKRSGAEQESDCSHFPDCGGCSFRTLPYEEQLKLKESQVRSLLNAVCEDPHFEGILPSPAAEGYRNKMEFSFGDANLGGELALGMHRRGSFYDIVTADQCRIADKDFRMILSAVLKLCREWKLPYYHRTRHTGYLRHLLVRKAVFTGEILTALITTRTFPAEEAFEQALTDCLRSLPLKGTLKGILHMYNNSVADVASAEETRLLWGEEQITERLLGLEFCITPFSFFQTNSRGAQVLYEKVREYTGETKDKVIFDLYSGTGTIAQMLSPVARSVTGVEIVGEAVEAARRNAMANDLTNCSFLQGDVLEVVDSLEEKPDIIILDPPRDGIHPKALPKIIRFGVERIIYVSCKPTSLARDLVILQQAGYRAERTCCVDMFPATANVETVCLLSKLSEAKNHISVKVEMDEMDLTAAESKATYEEIQEWVQENYGFHVTHLNIAQVKRKHGIIERENYNKPKSENSRQPGCPEEKAKAIEEAMKYFQMI